MTIIIGHYCVYYLALSLKAIRALLCMLQATWHSSYQACTMIEWLALQQRRPMPVDVAAELFLGGPNLARGYIGRPDLTASAFVWASGTQGRIYKTGDRARWKGASGDMEFVGRVDFQVG